MTLDAWLALYVIVGAAVGVWLSIKHPRRDDNQFIVAIFVAISIAFWPFILLSFWLEAGDDSL